MLLSLLNARNDKVFLFAEPGLNAALLLARFPVNGPKITKLSLTVTYSYLPQ